MSKLPDGWELVQLGSLGTWGSGGTPKRTNEQYYATAGIPWLVIGDLNDRVVVKSANFITEQGLKDSSAKLLPIGTLLVAMYGSIGKLGITGIQCATNQAIAFCRPNGAIVGLRYLYHALFNAKLKLLAQGQGGAQQNISQSVLKAFQVPLAPLPEQTRIANQLDTLLARVQACNDRFDAIPALLKRFRQTVLDAATTGTLTVDWRDQGAKPWKHVRLREVASTFSYGSAAKSSKSGDVPVLRMGNIQRGRLDWSDLVFTSDQKEIEKYKLIKGDVLFNRTNSPELVGKTAVFQGEREAIYAGYLIRVRCLPELLPEYLNYCLGSKAGRDYCWSVKSDGVSQSNINAKKLADFSFRLPELSEQTEIIRRVDALFALADRIEARCTAARNQAQRLSTLVLAKAFRGELVPQDPSDEPASEVLARIAKMEKPTSQQKPKVIRLKAENMKRTTASTCDAILKLPVRSYSFDEMRSLLSTDYEMLKSAIFSLLSQPSSGLKQVFDVERKEMLLERFVK